MKRNFTFILFCMLSIVSLQVFSAAWVQPEGSWVLINNLEAYRSCEYWDKEGNLVDSSHPCFEQYYFNPYFEYGQTQKFTWGVSPYIWKIDQNHENGNVQFGSLELFGRYRLWQKDYSEVSLQLGYNVPFQNQNEIETTQSANVNNGSYLFQNFAEARLMYGTGGRLVSLMNSSWYVSLEGAYDQAFNGAADQLHFDMQLGWKSPHSTWGVEFKTLNAVSLHNPSNDTEPDFNLSTLEGGILYFFTEHVGLEVGVYQDIYGVDVGKGTEPFIALWVTG